MLAADFVGVVALFDWFADISEAGDVHAPSKCFHWIASGLLQSPLSTPVETCFLQSGVD